MPESTAVLEGLEEIKSVLAECGQSHLLKYWQELREVEQKDLLQQIQSVDLKRSIQLYDIAQMSAKEKDISENKLKLLHVVSPKDFDDKVLDEYRETGYEEIANGHVAVIVLAGGQATRLGMALPKGLCFTGLPSAKSLLQIQAERIKRLLQIVKRELHRDGQIYWYLLTSKATHMLTEKFFEENQYFGLSRENVTLFQQGELPCFDFDGKIILEEKDRLALSPDGNGGIYRALKDTGVLKDLKEKDVKYVQVYGVDNILVKVADPVFIGKCIRDKIDCAAKVVLKTDPAERLGLFCKLEDKVQVFEYSEMPKDAAELKEGDNLKFNTGNICNHFFTVEFLERVCDEHEQKLVPHIARKTFTTIGTNGDKCRPNKSNGVKLEKFIFDAFAYSQNFLAWQVERSEEFSPVKNSSTCQTDNFKTARQDLLGLHKKWVEKNGGKVNGDGVEVSPLLSYEGEGLDNYNDRHFHNGEVIYAEEELKIY